MRSVSNTTTVAREVGDIPMISSPARDSQFTNCMSHSLEHALRFRCGAEERRASWLSLGEADHAPGELMGIPPTGEKVEVGCCSN
jgi:hypothetical protein